jgi:hypothetical protein
MRRLLKWYRGFCLEKAKTRRVDEADLKKELSLAHSQVELSPHCARAQEELAEVSEALQNHEQWKIDGQRVRARVRWCLHGNRGSKEFYNATRQKHNKSSISELEDNTGSIRSSSNELKDICYGFYFQLYAARPEAPETQNDQDWATEARRTRLTLAMMQALDRPLSLEELSAALKEMAPGKAPGHDGVITKLYKRLWHVLGPDYLQMVCTGCNVQRIISDGSHRRAHYAFAQGRQAIYAQQLAPDHLIKCLLQIIC